VVATAKDIGDLGKRLITPAAIAVLVFGVWIVAVSAWNFTDTGVLLGLAGIAVTIVTGAGSWDRSRAAGEARSGARPVGSRDPTTDQEDLAVSRFDLVVLVLVVADMVFKPGS
jgi:hypothetical protein